MGVMDWLAQKTVVPVVDRIFGEKIENGLEKILDPKHIAASAAHVSSRSTPAAVEQGYGAVTEQDMELLRAKQSEGAVGMPRGGNMPQRQR